MHYPILISAYFSLFTLGLMDMVRGPIYPRLLEEFQISSSTGSFFFTTASFAGLLANLVSPWWMKNWSGVKSLKVFTFLQLIGCFGLAATTHLPYGFVWLLTSSFIFGLTLGGTGILVNTLVVSASPQRLHTKLLSGVHTMYGLAAIIAPLMASAFFATLDSWRANFYAISAFTAILFLYQCFFVKDQQNSSTERKSFLKNISLEGWLLATAMSFYVGGEMIISTRVVLYLVRVQEFTLEMASQYLTLFFVGLMAGRLFSTFKKIPINEWLLLNLSLLLSLAGYFAGFYINPIGFALCGLSMSIFFPTTIAMVSKIRSEESEQIVAVGMTGVAVVLMGMHWVFGLISDWKSPREAMFLGPLFLVITLVSLFIVTQRVKKAA